MTLTEVLRANKNHLVIMLGDIEELNCSDIEELMIKGHHLCNKAYEYAVNELGMDTYDIMYYPVTDSWGF